MSYLPVSGGGARESCAQVGFHISYTLYVYGARHKPNFNSFPYSPWCWNIYGQDWGFARNGMSYVLRKFISLHLHTFANIYIHLGHVFGIVFGEKVGKYTVGVTWGIGLCWSLGTPQRLWCCFCSSPSRNWVKICCKHTYNLNLYYIGLTCDFNCRFYQEK